MIRALIKSMILISWIVINFPIVIIMWLLRVNYVRRWYIVFFYRILLRIINLKIHVEGEVNASRPLMLVSNHSSYLDIFVLGQLLPISFTPKSEIRRWPIIGIMCVLSDCIFVERKRAKMKEAQLYMHAMLEKGRVLALYPEGTTSNGDEVLPFKSGFFSLAEEVVHGQPLKVQPATITYTHINGETLQPGGQRLLIAWYGEDTALIPHIFTMLQCHSINVTLSLHTAVDITKYAGRKTLAAHCETVVRQGMKP